MPGVPTINSLSPINWGHPLNRGCTSWSLCLPGSLGGGKFRDMANAGNSGVLTSFQQGSASGWRPANRLGGFGAIQFDGTDDCIAYGANFGNPGTGDFTMAISLRTANGYAPSAAGVMVKGRATAGIVNKLGILFDSGGVGAAGTLCALWTDGSGNAVEVGGSGFNDGKWHRAVAVYARGAGKLIFYKDGISVGSTTITANTSTPSTANLFYLGAYGNAGNNGAVLFYTGLLDDAKIWTRALSPPEIMSEWNLSRAGHAGVLNILANSGLAAIWGGSPAAAMNGGRATASAGARGASTVAYSESGRSTGTGNLRGAAPIELNDSGRTTGAGAMRGAAFCESNHAGRITGLLLVRGSSTGLAGTGGRGAGLASLHAASVSWLTDAGRIVGSLALHGSAPAQHLASIRLSGLGSMRAASPAKDLASLRLIGIGSLHAADAMRWLSAAVPSGIGRLHGAGVMESDSAGKSGISSGGLLFTLEQFYASFAY